ncbi:MAG: helix-turn-helix domain-containing protein [Rickettsiaceae bacterium]|nr:helix-turn-helix domain-containing protein [Rickettsiaceae bacterium]
MKNLEQIGDLLKKARNSRSLDLYKVSEDLRIRKKYLEAIESGSFGDIPGDAYASGYIRMYADYLGIEEDLLSKQIQKNQPQAKKFPNTKKGIEDHWVLISMFAVTFTILCMILLYRSDNRVLYTNPYLEEKLEDEKSEFWD